jgi:hypothetical protein
MDSKEFNIVKIETPEIERIFIRAREDNYSRGDRSNFGGNYRNGNRGGSRRDNYSGGNRNKFGNDRQRISGRNNYSREDNHENRYSRGNDNRGSSDMKAKPYSPGRRFEGRNSNNRNSRSRRSNFGRR